ncbi:MAG: hypothetical protein ACLFPH_07735 [Bacteroidales bacterium]
MNYLKMFRAGDFSLSAKDTINALVERTTPHYKKLVKLAGFLQLKKSREILKRKLQTKDYASPGERWAILLSLSRMGKQAAIDFCLKIAKRARVNDNLVYDIVPGFVYTRQKELTDRKKIQQRNAENLQILSGQTQYRRQQILPVPH